MEQNLATMIDSLELQYGEMERGVFLDHPAVRLNGLALLPETALLDGGIEAWIAAEGAAYCGLAFRAQNAQNFELAYAQPHTSNSWDALQYDPIFNGSNTWQMYHGPGFQHAAEVPTGEWFRLRICFQDRRALVSLGNQPPLRIDHLAHAPVSGRLGLWSYLPAWFSEARILPEARLPEQPVSPVIISPALVREWHLDGYGAVACEPEGFLNLNRYLALREEPAVLRCRFLAERHQDLHLSFGFSDHLELFLDGLSVFEHNNNWYNKPAWHDRGYVARNMYSVTTEIERGVHELTARLAVNEPFGWGLVMAAEGKALQPLHWF